MNISCQHYAVQADLEKVYMLFGTDSTAM